MRRSLTLITRLLGESPRITDGAIGCFLAEQLSKTEKRIVGGEMPIAMILRALFSISLFTKARRTSSASGWSSGVSRAIEEDPSLLGDKYTGVWYKDLLGRPVEEVRRLPDFLGADAGERR